MVNFSMNFFLIPIEFLLNFSLISFILDLVLAKFEKTDQIKQELESDLSKMSEKLSIVKAESLTLVNSLSKIRNFLLNQHKNNRK